MARFLARLHHLLLSNTRRRVTSAAVVVVIVGGGVAAGVIATGTKPAPRKLHKVVVAKVRPPVAAHHPLCPLTDAPAPGTTVPARPALLVKIGNEPGSARPQSGLNEADIVFDTPAEGFIMRYVAVYQCEDAPSIGPTRSVRWVDWNMVAPEFGSPILAFAGGIDPNVNGLAALPWLSGANLLEGAQSAGTRITTRFAPDNLYTSTAALYGLFKSKTTLPASVFDFAKAIPAGATATKSIAINFSYGTDVIWQWSAKAGQWLHTYSGSPDIDVASNSQVSTTNIVVEIVHYELGPYSEHGVGEGDVESQLLGTGPGYVARDGRSVAVTWHRPTLGATTTFTDAAGRPVDLAPGRTWVEIVTDAQASGITVNH